MTGYRRLVDWMVRACWGVIRECAMASSVVRGDTSVGSFAVAAPISTDTPRVICEVTYLIAGVGRPLVLKTDTVGVAIGLPT